MNQLAGHDGFPRQPLQQRAKDRFERVLEAARELLLEKGLSGFSIPELAVRLDYSRTTIYNFFPTPYTILNELTRRYLKQLEQVLIKEADQLSDQSWRAAVKVVTASAADFYNENPVASLLILGGPTTDDSYCAQELLIQRLGMLSQGLLAQRGIDLPPPPPNIAFLAVEIGTACYRVSHFLYGKVTPEYGAEAARAMTAYLSSYIKDEVNVLL